MNTGKLNSNPAPIKASLPPRWLADIIDTILTAVDGSNMNKKNRASMSKIKSPNPKIRAILLSEIRIKGFFIFIILSF